MIPAMAASRLHACGILEILPDLTLDAPDVPPAHLEKYSLPFLRAGRD